MLTYFAYINTILIYKILTSDTYTYFLFNNKNKIMKQYKKNIK